MRTPTQTELLDLWDAGARASPWKRAALLLEFAWPGAGVMQWPVGLANARLLELRAALFGASWNCVADCPACAKVAEVRLDIGAMLAAVPAAPACEWHALEGVRFRLPLLGDLAALSAGQGGNGASLFAAVTEPQAPAAARAAIARELLELDPLAAIDIVVDCPSCGRRWRAAAELGNMLWSELSALAQRLLGEVARLAFAFGWSETQILALPAARRQRYLDMVPQW